MNEDIDTWLPGLDPDFDIQWEQTYSEEEYLSPAEFVRTASGGYAIAATVRSSDTADPILWLGRTDDCGRLCWSRTYDSGGGAAGLAERRRDGRTVGYALARGYSASEGWWGVVIAPDGTPLASRLLDTGRYTRGEGVVATDEGYAFLATANPQPSDTSFYVVATDDELDVRWSEYYGRAESYDHIEEAAALTYVDGEYGLGGTYLSGGDFDTAQGYIVNVVEDV